MKVYIAAKFPADIQLVHELVEALQAAGHEITHDWTTCSLEIMAFRGMLKQAAIDDYNGVVEAEALILIPHPRGKGQYYEAGIADGLGKHLIAIGTAEQDEKICIFLRQPKWHWVPTPEAAVALVTELDRP